MKRLAVLLLVALFGAAPLGCEGEAEIDRRPNGVQVDTDRDGFEVDVRPPETDDNP